MRCRHSGSKVVEYSHVKWDAIQFVEALEKKRATLVSLVPAQIFDRRRKIKHRLGVRAVLVGGRRAGKGAVPAGARPRLAAPSELWADGVLFNGGGREFGEPFAI